MKESSRRYDFRRWGTVRGSSTDWPLTLTISSSMRRPARSAGLPGTIWMTPKPDCKEKARLITGRSSGS